ncbi:MAG TPA: VIT domain-containing protein [Kofleriaceae bacterium]|nr:VIT domain-containing protein [Kofleriaceae bacterium]
MRMRAVSSDRPVGDAAPPFTLTASDGSGLALTRLDARAVAEGPLAYTELHLYFHNPEGRTREGTFTITLPSGAAVSRFAMELNGQFQEAEVVEKAKARRVYEDFLHRKQDPALLEKAAGNQFSARVFPIPANADKHLVLSFSQELVGRGYTLPLLGLPRTAQVDVRLDAVYLDGTHKRQTLSERHWQPDHDFTGDVGSSAAAVTAGNLVVGAIPFTEGDVRTARGEAPRQILLGVDTSASRALGFRRYVHSIRGLVGELRATYGDPIELQVVAFDQDTQPIFNGSASDFGEAQELAFLERGAAGASDFSQLFATIGASRRGVYRRVVIVTDGVATAGPDTPELLGSLRNLPVDRVDVILSGGLRDDKLAASLVRALPRAGDVFDLDDGVRQVAAGLGEPVAVGVPITIPGATWVYPTHVPAARPASSIMVYAKMPSPTQAIDIYIGGKKRTIGLGTSSEPLVQRAVAGAEIAELEEKLATAEGDAGKALREDIAERSVASRVLSSQTSMLVLETERDYDRYQIERTALADILVVGDDGIAPLHRDQIAVNGAAEAQKQKEVALSREEAIEQARNAGVLGTLAADPGGPFNSITGSGDISAGFDDRDVQGGVLGNEAGEMNGGFGFGRSGFGPGGGGSGAGTIGTGQYGTIGHGSGTGVGYGVGGGRGGMRGRSASVPMVRIGQPATLGSLDKAIIRRYIKRNIQRITYCYERELLTKPGLKGDVLAQFTIMPSGRVVAATASGVDPTVSSCVGNVIGAIEFPRPRDGSLVKVNYPFTFSPSDSVQPKPDPRPTPAPMPPTEAELAAARTEAANLPPVSVAVADSPSGSSDPAAGSIALTGKMGEVMVAIKAGNADKALTVARAWHDSAPGDVLALLALGEALEATKDVTGAARMYGSIIDLYSSRADLRRLAGERLERLGVVGRSLAVDTYAKAVRDRPDHATGHRLLAYALVRKGDMAAAFDAILAGVDQEYPNGRFRGADRVMGEDAGMIGAAYIAAGAPRVKVMEELTKRSLSLADGPTTRFIMYWETDANDVDFHIYDARGGHAWYSEMSLPSGGELYADVTTGYGPECFAIKGRPAAAPYKLSINYYSQGPMGFGMGLLQIQSFDGKTFRFEDRPYVIMQNRAFVDLGSWSPS